MLRCCLALIVLLPISASAQTAEEVEVARDILRSLQGPSFAKGREYCGFIGYDANGVLKASAPVAGTQASCYSEIPRNFAATASYHTHGDFDMGYINEIPSDIDIEGDAELRINGYVATPGGRFWFVDTQKMEVRQLCGPGCLPIAPGFYKGANGTIALRYSYEELLDRLGD
jgi:hypothetical protein